MSEKSLDFYISDVSEPFGLEEDDQVSSQIEGYIVFRQQSILDTIGEKECETNINLFLDEVLSELTKNGKKDYLQDILGKIVEIYDLRSLYDISNDPSYFSKCGDKVIDLLKFLESDRCTDLIAISMPLIDFSILSKKDQFIDFLNIYYKDFLKGLEKNRFYCPDLFYEFFTYAEKLNAFDVLWKIIQKDKIGLHSKQVTKGE